MLSATYIIMLIARGVAPSEPSQATAYFSAFALILFEVLTVSTLIQYAYDTKGERDNLSLIYVLGLSVAVPILTLMWESAKRSKYLTCRIFSDVNDTEICTFLYTLMTLIERTSESSIRNIVHNVFQDYYNQILRYEKQDQLQLEKLKELTTQSRHIII